MTAPRVDILIACSKFQESNWWQPVMAELISEASAQAVEIGSVHAVASAMPDHNKNHLLDDRRMKRTDANRNKAVKNALTGNAEWFFWIDDDTVPPRGALSRLLQLAYARNVLATAGLYFMAKPPHNPIAYMRNDNGTYSPLWDYPHAAIIEVDSVGMGCTLTHRRIFEKLKDAYSVFMRPNGSLYPVHQSLIFDDAGFPKVETERVVNGQLVTPVVPMDENDQRPFPFFAMEYARTEDHFFWELCRRVNVRPVVDTSIICRHWRSKDYGFEHYVEAREATRNMIEAGREASHAGP